MTYLSVTVGYRWVTEGYLGWLDTYSVRQAFSRGLEWRSAECLKNNKIQKTTGPNEGKQDEEGSTTDEHRWTQMGGKTSNSKTKHQATNLPGPSGRKKSEISLD